MADKDYYVILGVPRTASEDAIRAAYRKLAKQHHPDRAGQGGAGAFREVSEAYETLSDPERRRDYNRQTAPPPKSPPPPPGEFLNVEVVLTPEEAFFGGTFSLGAATVVIPERTRSGTVIDLPAAALRIHVLVG